MRRDTVGRPMEILMVEDDLSDARLAIFALRDGHVQHRLTLVVDGDEALDFLHQRGVFSRAPRPDLILLDLELPRKDGRELLAELKEHESLREIPVVVLTASHADEAVLRAEHLQVEAYMTKPVDMEQFLDVVRKLKRFWLADVILPACAE